MLKILVGVRTAVMTDVVEDEIRKGAHRHAALQAVLESDWLELRSLSSDEEMSWYLQFAERLVGSDQRNLGETSVLAWAKANGDACVVIDDSEARKIADEFGVPKIGTLGLLVDAVNDGHLSEHVASHIADEYSASGARVPFRVGGFIPWAHDIGALVPRD
ncbi:MAG TPA: hypothetical protein VIW24_01910 [Aldersonia sp.]